DPARAQPGFDDSHWTEISTLANYEKQGFANYDGYSWYRFHVRIPSSLKSTVRWPQRLHLYLSSIDDVDQTYLNGTKVGELGQFPDDPQQYATRWNALRDYYVDVATGLVHWDEDNVIAVRVYDGAGGGGFYRDMPTLSLAEIVDGLGMDLGHTQFDYGPADLRAQVQWENTFPVVLDGRMDTDVYDAAAGKVLRHASVPFHVDAHGKGELAVAAPQRAGIEVRFKFTEATTGAVGKATLHAPYLLTPAELPKPRINGASVLGVRPGSPIYYRIAATGKAPLRFSANALPKGLVLNERDGVITGAVAIAGDYRIQLQARNALGRAAHTLTLRVGDQLALTPPMGWNSWNAYGLAVDAAKVRGVAEAMVTSGLAAHGWTYINIDDGWEAAERAANGEIRTNEKFPDMLSLSTYLHERGLRFGIYSSPGPMTCGRFLGSQGHERQDADSYARWGVDYLKYDLCSYELTMPKEPTVADHQAPYRVMGTALAAQPRDIVFSLCQYGNAEVWKWGGEVRGNLWRTTGDIEDSWQVTKEIIDSQHRSAPFAHPGHWNDPDMLVVGEVGWGGALHPSRLTPDEQYSHISLWSLLAAPLLLGNELTHLDAFTRNLLINDEVIAIDQDPQGHAARKAWESEGWQIWVRELESGRKAVGVFNFGEQFRKIRLAGRVPELIIGAPLRDVWRQRDLAPLAKDYEAGVPAHGVVLLVVGQTR
ncbi:MAG: glycoside hydrolase family 27 protein, partial [Steroidobacteraceae bacterium]